MEVVVTAGAIKHARLQSNCHLQQTNIQFFTGQCPSSCPTNTVRALLESALKQNLFYSLPCTIYNVWNFSLLVLCACNYDHLSSFDDNTLLDM